MKAVIYHNPRWSKSRESVKILDEKDINYEIINYINGGLSKSELKNICKLLNVEPIQIIRTSDKNYKELNISLADTNNDELINIIAKNPKILQRPIIINDNKARIGRPPEKILEIL